MTHSSALRQGKTIHLVVIDHSLHFSEWTVKALVVQQMPRVDQFGCLKVSLLERGEFEFMNSLMTPYLADIGIGADSKTLTKAFFSRKKAHRYLARIQSGCLSRSEQMIHDDHEQAYAISEGDDSPVCPIRADLEQQLKYFDGQLNMAMCFWSADANLYGADYSNRQVEIAEQGIADVKAKLEALAA
jgi:hypothetical protein